VRLPSEEKAGAFICAVKSARTAQRGNLIAPEWFACFDIGVLVCDADIFEAVWRHCIKFLSGIVSISPLGHRIRKPNSHL